MLLLSDDRRLTISERFHLESVELCRDVLARHDLFNFGDNVRMLRRHVILLLNVLGQVEQFDLCVSLEHVSPDALPVAHA